MNAVVDFLGFVASEPSIQETTDGTPTALVTLNVFQRADGRPPIQIPLRFIGASGVELAAGKLCVGAFVEVRCSVGNMKPGRINDYRFPSVIFDVEAMQVIDRPDLSAVPSVEDFVRMYSAEAIAFRSANGRAPTRKVKKPAKGKGDKK